MEKKNKTRLARAAMTLLLALLTTVGAWAQTTVTIGNLENAENDSYLPMNSLYEYSYTQQIYTADEIGMAGTITSITLWLYGNANLYEMPFDIYIVETDKDAFESTSDWVTVTTADIVYSGSITVHNTEAEAYTFELSTPFVYSGTGNLVICFDNNTGQWKSGLNGKVFTATDNITRAIYARRDGTDYDPTGMSGITANGTTAKRNVITLDITPSGTVCEKPETLVASEVTTNSATLTWTGGSGTYNVEYKKSADTDWTNVTTSTTETTTTLTDLEGNTAYEARVRSVCDSKATSGWKTVSFTTENPCATPTNLQISNITTTSATVTWTAGYQETEWKVQYLKDGESNWNEVTVSDNPAITLNNLEENTSYYLRIYNCDTFLYGTFKTLDPNAAPTNLHFSNITVSSATLSWTPGYQETTWTVKYKKSSETDYSEPIPVSGTPTLTLTDLEGLTTYNVQVYNGDKYVSGNFTTGTSIPLVEGFGTSIPTGWALYTGLLENVMNGTALSSTSYGWSFGMNNGVFDNHARVNIYGTSCYRWLVMPTTKMEDNVQLTFDLALTAYNGTLGAPQDTGTDDKFVVLITTDGGTTWTVLRQWDNAGSEYVYNNIACSAVGQNVAIDLSSYAGQNIAIAFYGESTASNADNNLHIDNVSIDYIPDCAKPTGLAASNVTAHGATITWTSDASTWQIQVDEEDPINVTTNPYTLTGLTAETAYSVKVRTDCGGTYSEWTNPVSFTTGIACQKPTNVTVSNITGHGATVTWDAEEGDVFEYALALSSVTKGDAKVPSDLQYQTVSAIPLTLTDLDPETEYVFYLRKNCGSVDGYSQIVTKTFKTTVACPAPTGLKATLTPGNGSVATLSWTEPGDAAAWVVAYKVEGEEEFTEVAVTENPYTLTGLTPETAYTAKVKAVCGGEDGESLWSSTVTFTPTNAYILTVNDGTNTNNIVPVYGLWVDSYSKSQFIIPAADLAAMQYGIINKLTFYSSNANVDWGAAEFEVYMTEVNNTTFENSTLIDWTTMDKVKYAGSLSISGNKMEVVLDETYQYMGDNLLIGILQTTSGTYSSCYWYGVSCENNVAIGGYENSKSIEIKKFLPKTTFGFTPGEAPTCIKPKNLEVSEIGRKSVKLSWTSGAEGQNAWQICVNGDEDNLIEADTNPFALTGLTPETEYSVKVRANCGGGDVSGWSKEVTFTTEIACPVPTDLMASNISTSSATLSWNSLSNNTELRYAANSYQVFQGYVTNPGAMANGADASWLQDNQSTWGPGVQYTHGNMLADDFTVYTPIKLSEIEVYGYQTGSTTTSTFTALHAQIFAGNPADVGTAIWGDMDTNIMTGTSFTNCYRGNNGDTDGMTRPIMAITASNLNIELEPGTYWLVYSLEGTGSSGPWGVPNAEPTIGSTGEGLHYIGDSGWEALEDHGSYGCAMKLTFGVDIESLEWTYVNNINGEEYNLTNLDPNTPYIVQIRSNYGDDGNSTWVSTYFYTQGTAEITFAAEGYATYFNGLQDAVLPAGMKAKIVTVAEATGTEDATLTYETIANGDTDGNVVPKETAVMLQVAPVTGTATQKKTIILTTPSAAAINKTNLLYGSDEEMEIEDHPSYADGNYYYMLSYETSGANIGWYWGAAGGGSFTSLAHKAWLALPNNLFPSQGGAPFLGLPGWEETTGIVPVGVNPEDGEWYTLQGLKIGKKPTTKGVYIHNGKKVLIP